MIELRPAESSEYAAIALLHAASWQKNYRGIMSNSFLDNDVERVLLKRWHDKMNPTVNNQEITVAVQEDNIIGFSCLYLDDDVTYGSLLDNLHVSTDLQKAGVGKLLMKNCADLILNKSQMRKMYLWVFEANMNARRVYERLGGLNVEIISTKNEDETEARVCRYLWKNINTLMLSINA